MEGRRQWDITYLAILAQEGMFDIDGDSPEPARQNSALSIDGDGAEPARRRRGRAVRVRAPRANGCDTVLEDGPARVFLI
jgi:hypothetical protein